MKSLVSRRYLLPFSLITLLFFIWGAARSVLDVLNKHFQQELGMSHEDSSMVQVMFYLGYFLMALPAGLVIERRGYRAGVVSGLSLFGFGALLFWPGAQIMSFPFFLCSLFIIACGLVFLETSANPYVAELGDRDTSASRLNLAQSFNGMGSILGPVFGGMILFTGGSQERIALPYIIMAAVAIIVAIVFTRVQLPEIKHEDLSKGENVEKQKGGAVRKLFSNKVFVFGLAALLFYEIAEIGVNSYFVNYVTDQGWMTPLQASTALSFGPLTLFMLARVVCSCYFMPKFGAVRVLKVCAAGTLAMTVLVIAGLGYVSLGALFLNYVFESIMFPTIFALSLDGLGDLTKRASSFIMMTPIGGAIGTWLIFTTGGCFGTSTAFIIPFIGYVVVAAYAFSRKG